MCNGDIFEGDVEFLGTLEEVGSDAVGDGFTLSDEFCGIELSYDGLQDFVTDGGEDSLVVILAEVLSGSLATIPSYITEERSKQT